MSSTKFKEKFLLVNFFCLCLSLCEKIFGPEVYLCHKTKIYTTILLRKSSFTSTVNPLNDPIRPKIPKWSRNKLWVTIWATSSSTWVMFRHSFLITLLPITSSYLLISRNVFLYEFQLKIEFIKIHHRLTVIPTLPWRFESCVLTSTATGTSLKMDLSALKNFQEQLYMSEIPILLYIQKTWVQSQYKS